MKSADLRDRNDAPARGCLDFPRLGAVAIERLMRAGGVVVREVSAQQASEMLFVDHDDEIESFAANGADDALGEGVLPGRVHVLILGERHLRRTLARSSRTTTRRALTSRSTRMPPTVAQLSGQNSARSSRLAKSVAFTIATSDERPDGAQAVHHAEDPWVTTLAAYPGLLSLFGEPGIAARLVALPPTGDRESPGVPWPVVRARPRQPSGMRFWRRTAPIGRWLTIAWEPRRFLTPYAEKFVEEVVDYARTRPQPRFIRHAPPLPRPTLRQT